MADELRDIIESVRSRVQAELEGQLKALTEKHQHALGEARRAAEEEGRRAAAEEAEQATAARLQIAREEAQRRTQEAIAAVRAELERERAQEAARLRAELEREHAQQATKLRTELERERAEEANRLKVEAERRAMDAAARVRAEMEQALAAEREQAKARTEAEKRRASEELQKARSAFDAVRAADRAAHEAARLALEAELATRSTSASAASLAAESLLAAIHEIDAADSISATLAAMVRAAEQQAARAAVFVASGEQLREFDVPGTASLTPAPLYVRDQSIGVIGEAVRKRELVSSDDGGVPSFAGSNAKSVVAAPLLLEGQVVGVLYGHDQCAGQWSAALDVIASHGAARLGFLTALRTAQAMRWIHGGGATPAAAVSSDEEEQAARRYARLLVSEIKLYNEGAVRVGRENRDLMRRLASEIDRARRMFDERVPGRAHMFQHELVQTLAGGDASLLD